MEINWFELTAAVAGLVTVSLFVYQNIWCWPVGLVQVTLYVYVYYEARLYSDAILHIIYIGVHIYGWYHWLHGGKDHGKLAVTRMTIPEILGWSAVALAGTAAWGYFMASTTNADLPYWDAFILAASLTAQWLTAQKRLECWWYWIAVDVVAIGVYYVKDLYFTTVLYAVFIGLCVAGLIAWQRSLKADATDSAAVATDGGVR